MASSFMLMTRNAGASFNANNIMDDGVFDNVNTMDASQIDAWLNNNFGSSSCISTDHGFSAPQPIGYSPTGPTATGGFSYGGNVSAGTVIYDAAKVYGINPQVLLTTLEAQEGLLDGTGYYGCTPTAYTQAMGYDCPDGGSVYQYSGFELYAINGTPVTSTGSTGTCVDNAATAGFSRQVVVAAWQLSYDQQRSEGNVNWNVQVSNFPLSGDIWDNSDDPPSCYPFLMTQGTFERSTSSNYCPSGSTTPGNQAVYYSGNATIDGTNIYLDNGATAALYDYTPHFAGNENFDSLFEQYFGGIYAQPYYASYYSQSGYPQLNPGQQETVSMSYQNLGSQPWYDNVSISTAPSGTYPVHLATANQLNRQSAFGQTWPNYSRPAVVFSAVYLSDGTTLAPNQHVAQPGQIVEFTFTMTDPQYLPPATYPEYFQPVAEGSQTGLFNDPNTYLNVTVNPVPSLNYIGQSDYPTIAPGMKSLAFLKLQNNGNVPLYDSASISSAPTGTEPVALATSNPLYSASNFSSGWPSTNVAANTFAAIYNADGTTLASNQHVAQPGQIVEFEFNFTVPQQFASATYTQYFQPVLAGTANGYFVNQGINWPITVPSTPVIAYSGLTNLDLASGEPSQESFQIENLGNASTASTDLIYTVNGSPFQTSSWSSANTPISIGTALSPGQSTTVNMPLLSPNEENSASINFDLSVVQSGTTTTYPQNNTEFTVNLSPPIYQSTFVSQSAYPQLTYNQEANVYFEYQNTGNQPWYDDTSIGSATWRTAYPVHLATADPLNRQSGFDYGWVNTSRPAVNLTAVYEPDGTTLAPNQHVVEPGEIGKYAFVVSPASWVTPNTYREYFQLVAEGTSNGAFNNPNTALNITVLNPTYVDAFYSQSNYPTISPGSTASVYFMFKNIGTASWFDNSSIGSVASPSEAYPVHLATSHPLNYSSPFSATWINSSRPAVTFSAVYESNGTTLAPNQHIVTPGEIGEFAFTFTIPSNYASGSYTEYFQPVAEGSTTGLFNDIGANQVITVP